MSDNSLPYRSLILSHSILRLRRMKFDLGSSPMRVAMFFFSTLALASYLEPVAALEALQ